MTDDTFDEIAQFALNGIDFNSAVHEFYRTYRGSGISAPHALKLAIDTAEKSIASLDKDHQIVMRVALYKAKS